jgi:hypothetical protein
MNIKSERRGYPYVLVALLGRKALTMVSITGHAVSSNEGRLAAFGLDAKQAVALLKSIAVQGDAAVVVARGKDMRATEQTRMANGSCLVAIVRNGLVVTFCVSRPAQLNAAHFRVGSVVFAC